MNVPQARFPYSNPTICAPERFTWTRPDLSRKPPKPTGWQARQDLSRFAFREAQKALERALTLMPTDPMVDRIQTNLALVEACDATGDRIRQQTALDEAMASAGESDTLRLITLLAGARFYTHTGKIDQAETQLEAALALAGNLK